MIEAVTNIRIAGLGGMGVLTSSLIVAEVFFRQGFAVKKAEVHGMSQRGGSVCSDVRAGERVWSPTIPAGEVDYLVLLDHGERALYEADLRPQAIVLEPTMIDKSQLPHAKALNVAMLGVLSRYFALPAAVWLAVIRDVLPPRLHAANETAFLACRQIA
jgi:indolepyruvate ferredoxin oxidoreductase, beta subunit